MSTINFFSIVSEPAEVGAARLLIASLRRFGGELKNSPMGVFVLEELAEAAGGLAALDVEIVPLGVPEALRRYPFGSKVLACARAEQLCPQETQSLVWMDPNCLVLQAPLLYELGPEFDAALRPVHIRNVGSLAGEAPDNFWQGVYAAAGVKELALSVESFVDRQVLRAYFNSHAFALRPSLGLCQVWLDLYESLLADEGFQDSACQNGLRRVFLFQAVLSALVASRIPAERIRQLPPEYNYPYHLQERVPAERRVGVLNELVTVAYEEMPFRLAEVQGFEVQEPLRGWLERWGDGG